MSNQPITNKPMQLSIYQDRKTVESAIKTLYPCSEEYTPFINSATQAEWTGRLFMNYGWLKGKGVVIPEIEELPKAKMSEYFVWLLETYCLGKDADSVVQAVIDLHKRVIAGEEVSQSDWADARDAARSAAWTKIGEIILEK
jgi:hypothetical protein